MILAQRRRRRVVRGGGSSCLLLLSSAARREGGRRCFGRVGPVVPLPAAVDDGGRREEGRQESVFRVFQGVVGVSEEDALVGEAVRQGRRVGGDGHVEAPVFPDFDDLVKGRDGRGVVRLDAPSDVEDEVLRLEREPSDDVQEFRGRAKEQEAADGDDGDGVAVGVEGRVLPSAPFDRRPGGRRRLVRRDHRHRREARRREEQAQDQPDRHRLQQGRQ
mmetsp:Transcript_32214/g.102681  ORF Transcript_32214/g.102681 Transcript_32214/m.102681 type:complete len:218 (+) Transcript_32214:234-887(+)